MTRNAQRNRIPSGDLTAYERWELPLLDSEGMRKASVEDEQGEVKPLTAEDLEAIHNQAVEEGCREGFEVGKKEGMDQGAREGYRVGYDEGLAAGREAGERQGLDEARQRIEEQQQRIEEQQQRLETLMASLLKPIEQEREATEAALMNLVTALSRAVIHRELRTDSSQISDVLRRALAMLPESDSTLRIRLHPDDADSASDAVRAIEGRASVIPDEQVLPGGCIVENSQSLVDFTVEKRYQKTVQQMLDTQLEHDHGEHFGQIDAVMGDMSDFHRDVLESEPEVETEPEAPSSRDEAVEGDEDGRSEGEADQHGDQPQEPPDETG